MDSNNRNYVIKFGNGTYYSRNVYWRGTTLKKATWLTHKDALRIRNKLNHPRIDMKASIEPRENDNDIPN